MVPASAPTAATSRSCILCFPATTRRKGSCTRPTCWLFVDDGSKDDTWSIIRNLHERDAHLFGGVKLSHNRSHQNALLAGLMTARLRL